MKGTKMSLQDFNTYVTEKSTKVEHKRSNINDRLKARNSKQTQGKQDKQGDQVSQTKSSPWRNATQLSGITKNTYKGNLDCVKEFPILTDTEVTQTSMGAWSQGIASIIAVKDLPQPPRYQQQVVEDYSDYSNSDDYSDDGLPPRSVPMSHATGDDLDWENDI